MKVGLGVGLLVSVLVPVALLLFGILDDAQAAAAVLLLAGLWTVVFGAAFGNDKDRLYNVGFGTIVAVLSTFLFLPLQYTAGIELLAIVLVVLASVVVRPKIAAKSVG